MAVPVSAAFALLAGFVLWPPGAVYWVVVAGVVGEGAALVLVVLAALALGACFARLTEMRTRHVLVGTAAAYVAGMAAIATTRPDSPVHLVLYALLSACLVAGHGLWTVRNGSVR